MVRNFSRVSSFRKCPVPLARAAKNRSVSESLRSVRGYRSDQGEVWEHIATMHEKQSTISSTGAMRDMYEQKAVEFASYDSAFPCNEGQIGFAAFVGGRLVGLDIVAWAPAWRQLHSKMVRSYAVEARANGRDIGNGAEPTVVRELIDRISAGRESLFPSMGLGADLRYEGEGAVGSCLLVDDQVIHLAMFPQFYPESKDNRGHPMATMSRRRSFRQRR